MDGRVPAAGTGPAWPPLDALRRAGAAAGNVLLPALRDIPKELTGEAIDTAGSLSAAAWARLAPGSTGLYATASACGTRFQPAPPGDLIPAPAAVSSPGAVRGCCAPEGAPGRSFRHARISGLRQLDGADPLTFRRQTITRIAMIEQACVRFIPSATRPTKAATARMDAPGLDPDELSLDAVATVVPAALEQTGDDCRRLSPSFAQHFAGRDRSVGIHCTPRCRQPSPGPDRPRQSLTGQDPASAGMNAASPSAASAQTRRERTGDGNGMRAENPGRLDAGLLAGPFAANASIMLEQSSLPGAPAEIAARIGRLPEDVMVELVQGADPAGVALIRRCSVTWEAPARTICRRWSSRSLHDWGGRWNAVA